MIILNSDLYLGIHKIPGRFGLEGTLKLIKFHPLPRARDLPGFSDLHPARPWTLLGIGNVHQELS